MNPWTDNDNVSLEVVQADPLSVLLRALGDIKALVIDLKDTDIAYVKQRIDKQWLAIDDLEKRKADKSDMQQTEARLRDAIQEKFSRTSDDILRVEELASTSDSTFDSIQKRLGDIEKETARIKPMEKSLADMSKVVGSLSALRWQIIGGVTAIGFFFLSIDAGLRTLLAHGRIRRTLPSHPLKVLLAN